MIESFYKWNRTCQVQADQASVSGAPFEHTVHVYVACALQYNFFLHVPVYTSSMSRSRAPLRLTLQYGAGGRLAWRQSHRPVAAAGLEGGTQARPIRVDSYREHSWKKAKKRKYCFGQK